MSLAIDVYAAPAEKFFVNSFILESATALVVVDTQFLVSTAQAPADRIADKQKPLAGIVVTHPHPDHFNGLAILLERFGPVPVWANQPTIEAIAATQAAKRAAWTPVYGDDYPKTDALPDHIIGSNEILKIGDIILHSIDLGPGESADITVLHLPETNVLIASDLIYNECHPWLAEHRTSAWLDQLAKVEAMFPDVEVIHPGHGPVGGRDLFAHQRDYILQQREVVSRHAQGGKLGGAGLAAVRTVARAGRDGWPLDGLIDMNAAALAEELGANSRGG